MEQKINDQIKTAFTHIVPELTEDLITACEEQQKGTVIIMKPKKRLVNRIVGFAAAVVLLVAAAFATVSYTVNNTVTSTVSLDVNPSVEIRLNRKERVRQVVALNDDARAILGDMDFEGSTVDVAVNAIIGSMLRNGYITELANSILVTVDDKDPEHSKALQTRLTETINTLIGSENFQAAVVTQSATKTDELTALAEQYGISVGKAELIQHMIARNSLYTFENLAPLSINELNLLSAKDSVALENTQTSGTASDKGLIGRDAALQAALTHAGLAKEAVRDIEIELDSEIGKLVYEVEFKSAGMEYEYDILAADGTVVKNRTDRDDDWVDDDLFDDDFVDDDVYDDDDGIYDDGIYDDDLPVTSVTVTPDQAKTVALNHAGLTADAVRELECELEEDDGRRVYKVEFKAKGIEYEYKISIADGSILEVEKDD